MRGAQPERRALLARESTRRQPAHGLLQGLALRSTRMLHETSRMLQSDQLFGPQGHPKLFNTVLRALKHPNHVLNLLHPSKQIVNHPNCYEAVLSFPFHALENRKAALVALRTGATRGPPSRYAAYNGALGDVQLEWLRRTLEGCAARGERACVLTHALVRRGTPPQR